MLILSNLLYEHNMSSYVIMEIVAPSVDIVPKQQSEPFFSKKHTTVVFCSWINHSLIEFIEQMI